MTYALAILAALYLLWVLYVATMNVQRVLRLGALTRVSMLLAYPMVFTAIALDIAVNQTLGTIFLLDLPRELTLSVRLTRLVAAGGWRGRVAQWIGAQMLDAFDYRGKHI